MATNARGYAAHDAKSKLVPHEFQRRPVTADDVSIKIAFCGICHSDIHTNRNEWKNTIYPSLTGHEIVGHVTAVGANVKDFKVGDVAGVGCLVNSCKSCKECGRDLENYCDKSIGTYNVKQDSDVEPYTKGGYSDHIVVNHNFVLHVPKNLDLAGVAPLLCAGITTYSPLRHWGVKEGTKLGVVGLGGLGHMAVKLGKAMGAEVYVFSRSTSKIESAKELGAHHVVISTDDAQMAAMENTLNVIIDCIGTTHDLAPYLNKLALDGTLVTVGAPEEPLAPLHAFNLIPKRRSVAGSLIGGIAETQEMLDFCGKHNIVSDIEIIPMAEVNTAYERVLKSDVKYRFVIDMSTL